MTKRNLTAICATAGLLAFSLATTGTAIAADKKPPRPERKVVRIPGNKAWVNTGVKIRPQDRVTITASGKVCFSNGEKLSCVDPDGWGVDTYDDYWELDQQQCNDPEPGLDHAALIGNVGQPDFLVGRSSKFSGKDGTLYLGINDCSLNGDYHNTGEFSAVIVVDRTAPPQR